MYPKINGLIDELHSRGMSSFLVTNAQFPDAIRQLRPVTQLYVSVDAATKESLKVTILGLFTSAYFMLLHGCCCCCCCFYGRRELSPDDLLCFVVCSTPGGRPAPVCRLLGALQGMPLAPQGVQAAHRLPTHAGVRMEHERGEGPVLLALLPVPLVPALGSSFGNANLTCALFFTSCRWMHMLSCWTSGSRTSLKSR